MARFSESLRFSGKAILLGGIGLAGAAVANQKFRKAPNAPTRRAAPEQVRTAVVDGIRMRWEEHGSASPTALPIVLVHGLPTNPRAWRYILPHLAARDLRCLAWEQVGFGGSLEAGLGRDLRIPAQADRLRSWLRHMGIDKAVFVAHDFGGGVVQHLATTSPEMFLGLVLTDSVAFENWPVPAVRAAQAVASVIEHSPTALVEPLFRAAMTNLGHSDPAVAAESKELFWRPYREQGDAKAFAHQLRNFRNTDTVRIGEKLRPMGCPTLVVWGERDPLGVQSARQLSARLDAELRIIPGAYHFTIEDHPEEVSSAVLEVIEKVPRTEA